MIASMSTARFAAWRTRRSVKGFGPVRAAWSGWSIAVRGAGGLEAHGVVVDGLDALDLGVVAARGQLLLGVEDPVERGLDVARGEWHPVVELHARTQLDFPRGVVEGPPRGGETRTDLARLEIARRQVVEHVVAEDDGLAEHGVRRVPVLHVGLERVHDGVVLGLGSRQGGEQQDERDDAEERALAPTHDVLHAARGAVWAARKRAPS